MSNNHSQPVQRKAPVMRERVGPWLSPLEILSGPLLSVKNKPIIELTKQDVEEVKQGLKAEGKTTKSISDLKYSYGGGAFEDGEIEVDFDVETSESGFTQEEQDLLNSLEPGFTEEEKEELKGYNAEKHSPYLIKFIVNDVSEIEDIVSDDLLIFYDEDEFKEIDKNAKKIRDDIGNQIKKLNDKINKFKNQTVDSDDDETTSKQVKVAKYLLRLKYLRELKSRNENSIRNIETQYGNYKRRIENKKSSDPVDIHKKTKEKLESELGDYNFNLNQLYDGLISENKPIDQYTKFYNPTGDLKDIEDEEKAKIVSVLGNQPITTANSEQITKLIEINREHVESLNKLLVENRNKLNSAKTDIEKIELNLKNKYIIGKIINAHDVMIKLEEKKEGGVREIKISDADEREIKKIDNDLKHLLARLPKGTDITKYTGEYIPSPSLFQLGTNIIVNIIDVAGTINPTDKDPEGNIIYKIYGKKLDVETLEKLHELHAEYVKQLNKYLDENKNKLKTTNAITEKIELNLERKFLINEIVRERDGYMRDIQENIDDIIMDIQNPDEAEKKRKQEIINKRDRMNKRIEEERKIQKDAEEEAKRKIQEQEKKKQEEEKKKQVQVEDSDDEDEGDSPEEIYKQTKISWEGFRDISRVALKNLYKDSKGEVDEIAVENILDLVFGEKKSKTKVREFENANPMHTGAKLERVPFEKYINNIEKYFQDNYSYNVAKQIGEEKLKKETEILNAKKELEKKEQEKKALEVKQKEKEALEAHKKQDVISPKGIAIYRKYSDASEIAKFETVEKVEVVKSKDIVSYKDAICYKESDYNNISDNDEASLVDAMTQSLIEKNNDAYQIFLTALIYKKVKTREPQKASDFFTRRLKVKNNMYKKVFDSPNEGLSYNKISNITDKTAENFKKRIFEGITDKGGLNDKIINRLKK